MAKIEIPLKKDYAGAFKYWVDTNTENGVCTIPEYICKGIVGMLGKQPVVTDTNVGDTIYREDALMCLTGEYPADFKHDELIAKFIRRIRKLPSAQPEPKWIPCSKQLPKQGQEVICQCRANIIKVLKLDAYGDWYQDAEHCYMGGFVIAWMPLPEPYKEGEMT